VLILGGTQLPAEEGSAVHKSQSHIPSLVDWEQAIRLDVSELSRCTCSRTKCL